MEGHKTFKRGNYFLDYKIVKLLGQGGFADTYFVTERKTKKNMALKVERIVKRKKTLDDEKEVFEQLQNSMLFPRYYTSGATQKYRYLAIEALGPSLAACKKVVERERFSLSTVLHVAIEMLRCIEELHKNGFVHRDIKPGNFLIRPNRTNPIVLVDFGLARRHIDPDTHEVIPAREKCGFAGTSRYASHNAHVCKELGRRDDLISWWYSIIELAKGELPWNDIDDKAEIYARKMEKGIDRRLCSGLPQQIHALWRCIIKYSYSEEPNYRLLTSFLVEAMTENHITFDDPFDWEHLTAPQKEHISAIDLTIPEGQEPTIPGELVPAVVPGEEEYEETPAQKKKKGCCCVQ